jgi:hypothetical protein
MDDRKFTKNSDDAQQRKHALPLAKFEHELELEWYVLVELGPGDEFSSHAVSVLEALDACAKARNP